MKLIDAHCHLDHFDIDERMQVIERARAASVHHLVVNGLWRGPGDFGAALDLARQLPESITATIGIHPHDAAKAPQADFDRMAELASDPIVHAIGETGLDYHYDLSPRGVQREVMRWHLKLAQKVQKPLVLHIRQAHADALSIFREEGMAGFPTQVHCFTGTCEEASAWVELGCHLSFSGALTFKNGNEIRQAARLVPIDRLLVETDSPYLAPVPHRGERCEPAFVVETLRCLASVQQLDPKELAEQLTTNTTRLFGIEGLS